MCFKGLKVSFSYGRVIATCTSSVACTDLLSIGGCTSEICIQCVRDDFSVDGCHEHKVHFITAKHIAELGGSCILFYECHHFSFLFIDSENKAFLFKSNNKVRPGRCYIPFSSDMHNKMYMIHFRFAYLQGKTSLVLLLLQK